MSFSKPKVSIDLEEYEQLRENSLPYTTIGEAGRTIYVVDCNELEQMIVEAESQNVKEFSGYSVSTNQDIEVRFINA